MAKGKAKTEEVVNEVNIDNTQINENEPVNVQDEPVNEPVLEVTEETVNLEVLETVGEVLDVVEEVTEETVNLEVLETVGETLDVVDTVVENDADVEDINENNQSVSIEVVELTQRYVVYTKNGKTLKKALTRIQHKDVVNGIYTSL